MSNGLPPAPTNDLGDPIWIDPGTLARTGSPPPGPIGLDAKSGSPKQASMADQIVSYVRHRLGQQIGDGQCYAAADAALRHAGAWSADHYGTITPDADYVWGVSVNQSGLRAGDVIQFRNYEFLKRVDNADGSFREDGGKRGHHTAIVERVDADGAVTVLEQNVEGSPVIRTQLYFSDSTTRSGGQTTTITVTGRFWFYRPQAR
jgi:hypothetical protein